jgi:uncharacterized protein (UPF0276 family)
MLDFQARLDLDAIAPYSPLSLHAVGLSLGSASRPDRRHLGLLQEVVHRYSPGLVSDHLAWNCLDDVHLPDLFPVPYNEEALAVVVRNVDEVQSTLSRQILVENPSKYVTLTDHTLTEAQFLSELVARTNCGVLLDINNIYVSAGNAGGDASEDLAQLLRCVPHDTILEIHLAGHASTHLANGQVLLIDDHGSRVCEEVWRLFETAIATLGPRPTLIEWDTQLPGLEVLLHEARAAQAALRRVGTPTSAIKFGA